jgi:hypothetical protein
VRYLIRRIAAREDVAVVELSISYNSGPWQYGLQLLEFRDDKVTRERHYVMEGWEAPDWRARWRSETPADPQIAVEDISVRAAHIRVRRMARRSWWAGGAK